MNFANHGGYCCGRKHIYNFSYPSPSQLVELQRTIGVAGGRCVEIVLTNSQIERRYTKTGRLSRSEKGGRTWHDILTEDFGFRRVMRFRNPGSTNICNVYLWAEDIRE